MILRAVEQGAAELISSDVLAAEVSAAPDPDRRDFAEEALALAASRVRLTEPVIRRAGRYRKAGMKAVDALHLAAAAEGDATYFCTTGDRFLRKARAANTGDMKVVLPAELALALRL